jgi:hypothetical protein
VASEQFEQLVNAWLDEPQRADLQAAVAAECAREPRCARLRDEYVRVAALIECAARPPAVNWDTLHTRIGARIDQAAAANESTDVLDGRLRTLLPKVESRVNWPAFHARVSQAVREKSPRSKPLQLRRWRSGAVAGLLAAAALLLLYVGLPTTPGPTPQPAPAPALAQLVVLPPAGATPGPTARVIEISICADADPDAPLIALSEPVEVRPANSSAPEIYFMLEPPGPTVTMASAGW